MSHFASEVTWTPIFGYHSYRSGLIVSPEFVKKCLEYKPEDRRDFTKAIWEIVKPPKLSFMPSHWIDYHEDSILLSSLQHPKDAGKWLNFDDMYLHRIQKDDNEWALTYSYHHTSHGAGDDMYNRWLEQAFAAWARRAHAFIEYSE